MRDGQILGRARQSFAQKGQADACRLFEAADRAAPLDPEDLRRPGRRGGEAIGSPLTVAAIALALMGLCGGVEKPLTSVTRGNRELPDRGAVTAREALTLIYPTVLETSHTAVLLIVTSGTDVTAEGRARSWEFAFHFPARRGQGVYSLVPANMDVPQSVLRLEFRLSPRPDANAGPGLPFDFVDSPAAARALSAAGADWTSGDPDMTLATKRLDSGEVVWATEAYGTVFTTPFRLDRKADP